MVSNSSISPYGVAVDGAGNVYFTDPANTVIDKWTAANSNVTTLVSNGLSLPAGVAVDAAGNLYIADYNNSSIEKWTAANSNLITLVSNSAINPGGVAVDSAGNVYVADTANSVINKWTAASNTTNSLVATGLANPIGVAVDGAGNVYIGDTQNSEVKELPYVFVDPTPKSESSAAGSDALPAVLPATADLLTPFAPTSDQAWLTIGGITNGSGAFFLCRQHRFQPHRPTLPCSARPFRSLSHSL